jgi:hypothetical protein
MGRRKLAAISWGLVKKTALSLVVPRHSLPFVEVCDLVLSAREKNVGQLECGT